ncbi:prepilin-type N-terminal cleavage/methylation domain-containing protein [Patescibacteria group bacterium]
MRIKERLFRRSGTGFTLIELLIVVAIIAVLIAAILLSMTNSRKRSMDASFKQTVRSIAPAIELCCTSDGGSIQDKSSGAGSVARVCSVESELVYPGDENVDYTFMEKDCNHPDGYRVRIYPGSRNSGKCAG